MSSCTCIRPGVLNEGCPDHGRLTVADIVNAAKADPVPDETVEEFAREMRMQYTALVRQGFTEDQALRIVVYSITALVTTAGMLEEDQ